MKAKSGGGITSKKFVNYGGPREKVSEAGSSQIGQTVAFNKGPLVSGAIKTPGKLGNEKALDVGAGGPGKGRDVHVSGSQGTHGPVNQGESRGFDSRGPFKGRV